MADYTYLDLIPSFAEHEHGQGWGHLFNGAKPVLTPSAPITLTHVVMSLVALAIILTLAFIARGKYADKKSALIPEGHLSIRNVFETIFDAVFDLMASMMDKHYARTFFPLIGSLSIYILFSNLMGLVPGLAPPTSSLNTNLACSVVVFVFYNFIGLREGGVEYLKHFMGPVLWLAPLMIVIELVGHAFRPISLAVRLGGNMTGDHMVLAIFGDLAKGAIGVPLLLPVPFLFLGLLVCVIQTLVFCLLSTIYISMALPHDDHH
jgi:F-type H+-transporting ATPase subunit a